MSGVALLVLSVVGALFPQLTAAATPVSIIRAPLWTDPSPFFAGKKVEIFAPLWNSTTETLETAVGLFLDENLVATTTLRLAPRAGGVARFSWQAREGSYTLSVRVLKTERATVFGTEPLPIPPQEEMIAASLRLTVDIDTDNDGIGNTADPDDDNDGIPDAQEQTLGTNPRNPDTDGDGLSDNEELARGTSPLKADSDGDGLSDGEEERKGTNPLAADTDGDGVPDSEDLLPTNSAVSGAATRSITRVAVSHAMPVAEGVNSLARQGAQRLEAQAQVLRREWEAERQSLPSEEPEPFSLWWRRTTAAALGAAAVVLRQGWIGWAALILATAAFLWLALRTLARLRGRRSKPPLRERLESASSEKEG